MMEAGLAIAFISTFLYTIGWSYAYFYYEQFNIGLLSVSIPKEYFFMYAFLVIKRNLLWFTMLLLLFFSLPLFKSFLFYLHNKLCDSTHQQQSTYLSVFLFILLSIFILIEYICFFNMGKSTAIKDYQSQLNNYFPSYPGIKIKIKSDEKDPFLSMLSEDLMTGCYRLLLRSQGNLFLFYFTGAAHEKMALQIISESKTEFVQVLPVYKICSD